MDRKKTAIVLIEFQKDWIAESGKINHLMKDRGHFSDAVEGGKRLLEMGRELDLPIVHCVLGFQEGHPELGTEGWGLAGVIPKVTTFTQGSEGAEFAHGFEPKEGEFIVRGRTGGSGFSGSNLDVYLRANGIRQIIIAGFATNVCVSSTMRHAHDLGYNVMVAEDACACFTKEQHEHEMHNVVHHFGKHATIDNIRLELMKNAA